MARSQSTRATMAEPVLGWRLQRGGGCEDAILFSESLPDRRVPYAARGRHVPPTFHASVRIVSDPFCGFRLE